VTYIFPDHRAPELKFEYCVCPYLDSGYFNFIDTNVQIFIKKGHGNNRRRYPKPVSRTRTFWKCRKFVVRVEDVVRDCVNVLECWWQMNHYDLVCAEFTWCRVIKSSVNIGEYFLRLDFICSGMIYLFIYLFMIYIIILSIAKRAPLIVE
jgi:hypothetical protein